jgi:hypothetical protein
VSALKFLDVRKLFEIVSVPVRIECLIDGLILDSLLFWPVFVVENIELSAKFSYLVGF